jgi:hypothetical protein
LSQALVEWGVWLTDYKAVGCVSEQRWMLRESGDSCFDMSSCKAQTYFAKQHSKTNSKKHVLLQQDMMAQYGVPLIHDQTI